MFEPQWARISVRLLFNLSSILLIYLLVKYSRGINPYNQHKLEKLANSKYSTVQIIGITARLKLMRGVFCQLAACWAGVFTSCIFISKINNILQENLILCSTIGVLISLVAFGWYDSKVSKITKTYRSR
jgi:hypothetical protein